VSFNLSDWLRKVSYYIVSTLGVEEVMAYYPDLSSCTYFGKEVAEKLIAVGWLDKEHSYATGVVSEDFIEKLIGFLVEPWAPGYLMGYEECPYCILPSNKLTYHATSIDIGALNLFVPGERFLYVMPSLAAHYILAHGYTPPPQFQQAVLRCPPMRSQEYFEAVAENAPQKYAEKVRKRYLSEP
jgi:hypothetical protein